MLNYIISYFLTIFTALCTWVKIDVMGTIAKKIGGSWGTKQPL